MGSSGPNNLRRGAWDIIRVSCCTFCRGFRWRPARPRSSFRDACRPAPLHKRDKRVVQRARLGDARPAAGARPRLPRGLYHGHGPVGCPLLHPRSNHWAVKRRSHPPDKLKSWDWGDLCFCLPRPPERPSVSVAAALARGRTRHSFLPLMKERTGWGGRDRTSACRNQNPVPYRLATPQ